MNLALAGAAVAAFIVSGVRASVGIADGDFDALEVGLAPSNGAPTGHWQIPPNYVSVGLGESSLTDVQVVSTSTFDPGAAGRSLWFNAGLKGLNTHVANIFDDQVHETPGTYVVLSYDLFVRSASPTTTWGGGTVYLAKDNGGGGFNNVTDRGPQVTFDQNRRITVRFALGGGVEGAILKENYPLDAWQTMRLVVNLNTDRFDVYHGLRGQELSLIGSQIAFRSGPLDGFDRVNIARFADFNKYTDAFYDNFQLSEIPAPSVAMLCGGGLFAGATRRRR